MAVVIGIVALLCVVATWAVATGRWQVTMERSTAQQTMDRAALRRAETRRIAEAGQVTDALAVAASASSASLETDPLTDPASTPLPGAIPWIPPTVPPASGVE